MKTQIIFTSPVPHIEPLKAPILYQVDGFDHKTDLEDKLLKGNGMKAQKSFGSLNMAPPISLNEFENLSLSKIDAKKELNAIFNQPLIMPTQTVPISIQQNSKTTRPPQQQSSLPLDQHNQTVAAMIAYKLSSLKNEPHSKFVVLAQNLLDMGFSESSIISVLQKHNTLEDAINALLS